MGNQELTQRISTHQDIIAELNRLSPSVEAYNMKIGQFILKNRGLIGLSYSCVEILMNEKDLTVRMKAYKVIADELKTRRDPNSPGYRFKYRKMSENRIRKILSACRPKSEKEKPHFKQNRVPIKLVCPYCEKEIKCIEEKREEVVAFRSTGVLDDSLDFLASSLGVSRSLLVNNLLVVEGRFGYALK